mmetsp:Transcript_3902/g.11752  ORF Transcript_3902/g.11752 Transcript_3902/m.11752 type:complete len:673 (+) Transcript_3902:1209-3227(+)
MEHGARRDAGQVGLGLHQDAQRREVLHHLRRGRVLPVDVRPEDLVDPAAVPIEQVLQVRVGPRPRRRAVVGDRAHAPQHRPGVVEGHPAERHQLRVRPDRADLGERLLAGVARGRLLPPRRLGRVAPGHQNPERGRLQERLHGLHVLRGRGRRQGQQLGGRRGLLPLRARRVGALLGPDLFRSARELLDELVRFDAQDIVELFDAHCRIGVRRQRAMRLRRRVQVHRAHQDHRGGQDRQHPQRMEHVHVLVVLLHPPHGQERPQAILERRGAAARGRGELHGRPDARRVLGGDERRLARRPHDSGRLVDARVRVQLHEEGPGDLALVVLDADRGQARDDQADHGLFPAAELDAQALVDRLDLRGRPSEHDHAGRHEPAERVRVRVARIDAAIVRALLQGNERGLDRRRLVQWEEAHPIDPHLALLAFQAQHREVRKQVVLLHAVQIVDVAVLDEQRKHVVVGGHDDGSEEPGDPVVRHHVVLHRVDPDLLQDGGQALDDPGVLVDQRGRHAHRRRLQRHDILAILAAASPGTDRQHVPVPDQPAPRAVADRLRGRLLEAANVLPARLSLLDLTEGPRPILRRDEDVVADNLVVRRKGLRDQRPEHAQRLVVRVHEADVGVHGVLDLDPVRDDVVQRERPHARDVRLHHALDALDRSVHRLHDGGVCVPGQEQ